ncbi:tRNA 2-thiouridine(34) synthase MnmA [Candidatus Saccharibacteria bacterium]|nr:tRNA 2-thiouridine(34) synthase MnmA [Candidatus Saccharibacteria bacterium]
MKKTVYVGLSGGVDSAVSALLLKQQGYRVVGVHMKNWSQDIAGFECPWREDYQEAKKVAAYLDIEFKLFDFETDYFNRVVQYMLDEFASGRTPNPDVMCNQEIKFKLFLEASLAEGADLIATGHYAATSDGHLLRATDESKDQTYFLYRIERSALEKVIFPLGSLNKSEVRQIASANLLPNAKRKESMGICFVGKVGIREFLSQYVKASPGDIIDDKGETLGQHEGAIFYTIGQRHGLGIGGGLPYYVTGKDMEKNEVYVTKNVSSHLLWSDTIKLTSVHWINKSENNQQLFVRTRHRAPLVACSLDQAGQVTKLQLNEQIKAITPGQSAVLYTSSECLGGGIIC